MIEFITPDRMANAILQDNSFEGIYVFVEGKKDFKVYSKFFDQNNTRMRTTFGCSNLLQVFDLLNQRGFSKKLGILDKDFMDILGTYSEKENVFYTDFHDVEVMMFISNAFDDFLRVCNVQDKVASLEAKEGKCLREIIFELSDNIGYLKLVEKKVSFGLVFKPEEVDGIQIKYHDFVTDKFKYKGDHVLLTTIINYSRQKTRNALDRNEIMESLIAEKKENHNSLQLSNGHDISNLIYILLKKTLRTNNKLIQDFNCIEDSLVLAYNFEHFRKTELYKKLVEWENQNSVNILNQN